MIIWEPVSFSKGFVNYDFGKPTLDITFHLLCIPEQQRSHQPKLGGIHSNLSPYIAACHLSTPSLFLLLLLISVYISLLYVHYES